MISNVQKVFIGACGGLALSILKVMQLNFYLDASSAGVVVGGILTLVAYLILGGLVGSFFAEESSTDKNKTRKSAFLMGLLAPSILLAITTKPVTSKDIGVGEANGVPVLHASVLDLLIPSAAAQVSETTTTMTTASSTFPIRVIEQKDTVSQLTLGAKTALGLQQPQQQAVYIVGKTTDAAIATKTAEDINKLLQKGDSKNVQATVIKPDSLNQFYVAVGNVTSPGGALMNEKAAKETALKTFVDPTTTKEKETAKVLSSGDVVSGKSLFKE